MSTDDLAAVFVPEKGSIVRYGAGKVISWNADGFANEIEFHGSVINDFSVFGGINALTVQPDDEVALLGYESPGGVSTWFVLGRIIPPGEAASTMVIRGGGMVMEGGLFRLVDRNGVSVVYFGDVTAGEEVSRGFIFRFDSGTLAFAMGGAPGAQSWGLRDRAENLVVSNDADTGVGLARPYIPLHMTPSPEAQTSGTSFIPSHDATSYTRLWYGFNPIFHPRVEIGVGTATSGGGTTEWRLLINGSDQTGTVSGSGTQTVTVPGWGSTVNPGDTVELTLEIRAAGGATRAFARVDKIFSLQS